MTRDQKLALIVGFSVVLLVGILISDHFSRARHTRVTTVDPAEPVRVAKNESRSPIGVPTASPATPASSNASGQGNASLWPSTAVPLNDPSAASATPTSPGTTPGGSRLGMNGEIRIDTIGSRPPLEDPIQSLASRLAAPSDAGPPNSGGAPSSPGVEPKTAPSDPLVSEIASRGGTIRETNGLLEFTLGGVSAPTVNDSSKAATPAPSASELASRKTESAVPGIIAKADRPADPRLEVLPMRQHKVAQGETLREISQRYYQDTKLWKKLARYNDGIAKADGTIRIGSTLKIPPKKELVGSGQAPSNASKRSDPVIATPATLVPAGTIASRGPDAKPSAKASKVTESKAKASSKSPVRTASATKPKQSEKSTKPATYTVRAGDTLSKIASRTLGSAKRVDDLVRANPGKLADDEATIRAGMVLRLPSM